MGKRRAVLGSAPSAARRGPPGSSASAGEQGAGWACPGAVGGWAGLPGAIRHTWTLGAAEDLTASQAASPSPASSDLRQRHASLSNLSAQRRPDDSECPLHTHLFSRTPRPEVRGRCPLPGFFLQLEPDACALRPPRGASFPPSAPSLCRPFQPHPHASPVSRN